MVNTEKTYNNEIPQGRPVLGHFEDPQQTEGPQHRQTEWGLRLEVGPDIF